jgi:hypothetical protein
LQQVICAAGNHWLCGQYQKAANAARKVDEFLMGHSNLESKDAVNQFDQVFY